MSPTLLLKNQFGEQSNNAVVGGSMQINCNFIVDSANGNGLGNRSLKGQGVKNVFMHTSASPLGGNPNPLAGFVVVQLEDNFAGYQSGTYGFNSPVSGTPISITAGVTAGQLYVITSLGTTTRAQWIAIGLAAGVVPAVGAVFVASVTGDGLGTGVVEVPLATGSGIDHLELIGNPNETCNPDDKSGALIYCQFLGATSAGSTVLKPLAPADGTVIGLTFVMLPNPSPVE